MIVSPFEKGGSREGGFYGDSLDFLKFEIGFFIKLN
jgi:hypothetical protein